MADRSGDPERNQEHYTVLKPQAIEVIRDWHLDYFEGNVIKYLARWRYKNGVQDLRKALTYMTWLVEREEARVCWQDDVDSGLQEGESNNT